MKLPTGIVVIPKYKYKQVAKIEVTLERKDLVICEDCKYYEQDSVTRVDGVPLILAHEICKRWGDGCKTNPKGWCFLAEKREEQA